MNINVIISGDFLPHSRVSHLIASGDYASFFSGISDVNADADYSIVNLEAPIVSNPCKPISKTGPNLKCNVNAIYALKYAGFDCVTLANNHFYDYGETGVSDTLKACLDNGIDIVGGGKNLHDAEKILYKKIKEKTIAIVNCCEHEWSIAGKEKGGSAPLDEVKNYYQIKEAESKADHVIVIVHGGTEHYNLPTPRMKKTYRFFIDAGADVVVNHHQHCISGYEVYNGKYIFYGLGNFCFDKGIRRRDFWNEGYLVKLTLGNNINFEIIPYVQCADNPIVDFIVDKDAFYVKINELNAIIADDAKLEQAFINMANQKEKGYLDSLQPYSNRYLKALYSKRLLPSMLFDFWYRYVLAIFRCEAHRDVMLHVLENKLKK